MNASFFLESSPITATAFVVDMRYDARAVGSNVNVKVLLDQA